MKKIISVILTLCMMCSLWTAMPMTASAATYGIYTYTTSGTTATITDCKTSASGAIEIPGTINGYTVTAIGDEAFYGCYSLTDVYYTGSEEDWNKISIEDGNEWLTDATIHFPGITSFVVQVQGEDAFINIKVESVPENATLYVASYGDAGNLLNLQTPDIENGVAEATFPAADVYKAFLWENENFRPIAEAKETSAVNE